ncbi:hypothetical protein M5K25_006649 [Dendrobium thyrsiflorum]|uniref:Uncharacterized protein n=1 Tax=Dendrobium thyrsiflorum TaxID=117978 RepID=A0ABD0VJ23_DENTH
MPAISTTPIATPAVSSTSASTNVDWKLTKCMGDPDVDHSFLYDDQGRVDILQSPFFYVTFGNDRTADEYVDRIIYQLTLAIEDQIPQGRWYIISRPSLSPELATSPATITRGVLLPTRENSAKTKIDKERAREERSVLFLPNFHSEFLGVVWLHVYGNPSSSNPVFTGPKAECWRRAKKITEEKEKEEEEELRRELRILKGDKGKPI